MNEESKDRIRALMAWARSRINQCSGKETSENEVVRAEARAERRALTYVLLELDEALFRARTTPGQTAG